MNLRRLRAPSPALVISIVALFIALGGVGYAAVTLPRNSVSTDSIRDGAVRKVKIRANAIDSSKIASNAVTGADVLESSLGPVPSVSGLKTLALVKSAPTAGADEASARAAAPEIPLFAKGQLTLYGKCFKNTGANQVRAEVFIRSTVDGAIATGNVILEGGDGSTFLNVATPELERRVDVELANANFANVSTLQSVSAVSPDGTSLRILTHLAAKNGVLAGPAGQGIYGNGDVCLFGGFVAG